MNIWRALGLGGNLDCSAVESLRGKLPEVNGFVEISVSGRTRRESVAVNEINPTHVITRGLTQLTAGETADFVYTTAVGKFRFSTVCARADAVEAAFNLPDSIKTIESFGDRRAALRVPWVMPVEWRYAPDGHGYGDFLPASMMDISCGGASLVVGRELKAGAQVEIRFAFQAAALVEIGEVVRAAKIETSDKNAAGIRFLEVGPEHERLLSAFVHERQTIRRDRGVV